MDQMDQKQHSAEVEDVGPKSLNMHGAVDGYIPDTDEEKRLVRKIDLYLLPTIWIMYLLSYVDRTNIGNAKVAGMATDLHLDSNRYSIVLVVFFVVYVAFGVPYNMVLSRIRPSIFLPTIMFLWGCVTIGMGFAPTYKSLIAFRIIIGSLEAGFAPGVLLLLSSWYKRNEQSKRFSVYISAAILSGAFGGLIAGGIEGGLDGHMGIAGWRWLFIIEGALSAGWAIIASFILLDFPANSMRLTERERELAVQRILSEGQSVRSEEFPDLSHREALILALKNWRTWAFTVGYMGIVGSSTLTYFYPTLVKNLGYTSVQAQYMTVPIYAAAFVCTGITGYLTDKVIHLRGLIIASWLAVSCICSIIICVMYNLVGQYVLLVIMASGLWVANALSLSYASSTFGSLPNETKAVCLAIVNSLGNLAQIYGSYLFPSTDAPKYIMGFGVISGLCALSVASYVFLHVMLKRRPQN
ncbi:MFS transporter [Lachnellula occidentalis]|uniref:MFS transporter n=1 Tax=Lachnellula occidentalis TaxID=215460 RepID=A0A8H8RPA7_9HELO|nr:MFS transporter [Lachnellula occidentalis]